MHWSIVLPRISIATLVCLSGCTSSILQLRGQSGLHDKLKADPALAKQFLTCSRQPYSREPAGDSGPPAPSATAEAQLPTTTPSMPAVEAAVADSPLLTSDEDIRELLDLIRDMDDPTDRKVDVGRLIRIADMAKRLHARFRIDEDRLAQDTSLFAQLLLAYNRAYFGDIQFRTRSTETRIEIQGVFKEVGAGFVDRNGNAFAFPGLSSEVSVAPDPAKQVPSVRFHASSIDSRRVASDLARIFLEALFDAAFQVPATQEATAVKVKWGREGRPYPHIDRKEPPISLDQFARVARDAMRAEATVTSLVGKAVRGAGVFGTNNETVAAAVETAAGVVAKKLVEHEVLCYFQVTRGTRPATESADSKSDGKPALTPPL